MADRDGEAEARALTGRRLGAAALLLAASVLLSRVMGFVREMVLAARIGVGAETDAYYAAFQIPDLLNYLLAGGALGIAFTPLYLRARSRQGEASADELFHSVLGTLGAIALVLTAALWLGADRLIRLQFPSFAPETLALTVKLTRIVLPGQIFFITGGIVRAVLMAHGRFGAQAAAPLLYNGAIIVGGLLGSGIEGFAWGALFGAILGAWAYPLYDMRHVGRVAARFAPFDPRFHAYLWQALPLMIGVSLTTVDEWYERWFGAQVGEGVVAALGFARRLMMAPVAIIGQAVAAAALPMLAALHAQGRERELDETLLRTLRGTLALAILAAGACFVLAEPIVDVIYRRGRFDAEAAARVASLLALLALAIPGWVTQQVAVRAFFARAETWRPMALGSLLALAAIPLYLLLGDHLGAEGLALAGVLAISANAVATLVWARLRYGGPPLSPLLGSGLRGAALTAAVSLLTRGALAGLGEGLAPLVELLAGSAVFLLAAAVVLPLLGDDVMRETAAAVLRRGRSSLRRLGRRGGAGGPAA